MSVRARVLLVPRPLPQTSISFCRITTLSFIVSFIAHFGNFWLWLGLGQLELGGLGLGDSG